MAMKKHKAGDKKGAIMALKKKKMIEKQLTKFEGQSMMLE